MEIKRRIEQGEVVLIEELELSVRSQNCLKSIGIKTVNALILKSASELLTVQNFGRKSLNEIKDVLEECGLQLTDSKAVVSTSKYAMSLAAATKRLDRLCALHKKVTSEIHNMQQYISEQQRLQVAQINFENRKILARKYPDMKELILDGFYEKEIIVLRERAAGKTLKEIGVILGVQSTRVSQIEVKASRKLRHPEKSALRPIVHRLGLCQKIYGYCECETEASDDSQ